MRLGLNLSLVSNRDLGTGQSEFSLANIFANGATGLWLAGGSPAKRYGPDQIPGLFTTYLGSTAIDRTGQAAGLVMGLDKGAAVGEEKIPGNDLSSFTPTSGNVSVDGDTFTTTATQTGIATGNILEVGKWYYLKMEGSGDNGLIVRMYGSGFSNLRYEVGSALFKAERPALYLYRQSIGSTTVTNISVKEVFGNHVSQVTAASSPALRYDAGMDLWYWEPDGADWWEAPSAVGTLSGDFEIHAAVRWTGNRSIISKMDTSHDSTSSPLGWMLYSAADRKPVFLYRPTSGGTIAIIGSNIIDDGTDVVISAWRAAGVITVAVDGAVVGQIGPTPSSVEEYGNFTANLQVFRRWAGSDGWGSYWNSRLYGDGLVIINNKSLAANERTSLIKYLAATQGRVL